MTDDKLPPQGVLCRDLVKDYGSGTSRVRALRGVTLEVVPGELTLLVGPSGCGKTTLISILAGTLDLTGGFVSVLGVELARLSKLEKAAFSQDASDDARGFSLLDQLNGAPAAALQFSSGSKRSCHKTLDARSKSEVTLTGLDPVSWSGKVLPRCSAGKDGHFDRIPGRPPRGPVRPAPAGAPHRSRALAGLPFRSVRCRSACRTTKTPRRANARALTAAAKVKVAGRSTAVAPLTPLRQGRP